MDWKKVYIWLETRKQAELLVKLMQDGYKRQAYFIRDVIEAYINDDPEFMIWMNKKRIERGNSRTKLYIDRKQKLINKSKELDDFLFSQEDLTNIFDLIEEDS